MLWSLESQKNSENDPWPDDERSKQNDHRKKNEKET
jgi:hypothetical protein